MSEMMDVCIYCNRMKAVDGYRFCGGSYCLLEAGPDDSFEPIEIDVGEDTNPEKP